MNPTGADTIAWARSLGCRTALELQERLTHLAGRGTDIVHDLTHLNRAVRDVPDDAICEDMTRAADALAQAVVLLRDAAHRVAQGVN